MNKYDSKLSFKHTAIASDQQNDGNPTIKREIIGVYSSDFFGATVSALKEFYINEHWSFKTGLTQSLNFLVDEKTYNKKVIITNITDNPDTKIEEHDNIPDIHNPWINYRIEVPIIYNYILKNHEIAFGVSVGVSTQSRIVINDYMMNLSASPFISYAYSFKRKQKE